MVGFCGCGAAVDGLVVRCLPVSFVVAAYLVVWWWFAGFAVLLYSLLIVLIYFFCVLMLLSVVDVWYLVAGSVVYLLVLYFGFVISTTVYLDLLYWCFGLGVYFRCRFVL